MKARVMGRLSSLETKMMATEKAWLSPEAVSKRIQDQAGQDAVKEEDPHELWETEAVPLTVKDYRRQREAMGSTAVCDQIFPSTPLSFHPSHP